MDWVGADNAFSSSGIVANAKVVLPSTRIKRRLEMSCMGQAFVEQVM